jgi:hypothetical protein
LFLLLWCFCYFLLSSFICLHVILFIRVFCNSRSTLILFPLFCLLLLLVSSIVVFRDYSSYLLSVFLISVIYYPISSCFFVVSICTLGYFYDWNLLTKKASLTEYTSELYRLSERSLSAKLVPTLVERVCHVVSVTDPHVRILGFLDRSSTVCEKQQWTVLQRRNNHSIDWAGSLVGPPRTARAQSLRVRSLSL